LTLVSPRSQVTYAPLKRNSPELEEALAGALLSPGSAAGNQIANAIGPILNEIVDRFGRGRRAAVDEATNLGNDAVEIGTKVGSDALERIAAQAKQRPLVTIAVAIGVGILIGFAGRRG
jgi:hypothetical protein